jgi:phosphoribosylformylglycinamidine synthase
MHFGGTQYSKQVLNQLWGMPPALDMALEKKVHSAIREMVTSNAVESAHDVGEGGLAVALAESCFGRVGARIALPESDLRPEFTMFHEGPSRVLISTSDPAAVSAIADQHGVTAITLGITGGARLTIGDLIDADAASLRAAWEDALPSKLRTR